jgi:hypothetical protein
MNLPQRFKKPLVVAFSFLSIFSLLLVIILQSTGILSASRQYSSLVAEAKTLGIPTTREELAQKTKQKGRNAFPLVKESLIALGKLQDSGYIYAETAQAANPHFQWKPKTKRIWDEFAKYREKLESITADQSYSARESDWRTYTPSGIHDRDINVMKGFASSLANQGKFEEAKQYFILASLFVDWQYSGSFTKAMSIRKQLELVEYILTFLTANPQNPILKGTVVEICQIALRPHDFREDYWTDLNIFVFNLDSAGDKIQSSMLTSSYGRSLLWLKLPIVLQATKSDLLRAHLEGYKLVEKDPYSFDVADKANGIVVRELGKSNSLTSTLIRECAPFNIAPKIKPIFNSLRLIEGKYR